MTTAGTMFCWAGKTEACSICHPLYDANAGKWYVSIIVGDTCWWQGRCVVDDFGNLVRVEA